MAVITIEKAGTEGVGESKITPSTDSANTYDITYTLPLVIPDAGDANSSTVELALNKGIPRGNNSTKSIFPSEKALDNSYDFWSSRNNGAYTWNIGGYTWNIANAYYWNIIGDTSPSGVTDWSTYSGDGVHGKVGGATWNYHHMYHLGWHRHTKTRGMKIVCLAGIDVIGIRGHHDEFQHFSLFEETADDTEYDGIRLTPAGEAPCSAYCENDTRIYHTAGYGHSQGVGAFGGWDQQHYHNTSWFSVHRSDVTKTYILIAGHHGQNKAHGGWMSGLSFNTNPNLFATNYAIDYHYATNGGEETTWSSGDWNENNLAYIPANTVRTLKIPIAPENVDSLVGATEDINDKKYSKRKFYVIGHADQYNQGVQYVNLTTPTGTKRYILKPDTGPIASILLDSTADRSAFYIATFEIDKEDLPYDLYIRGGVFTVQFDNQYYNQAYYFSEMGSYKAEEELSLSVED
jgi:hypothetical protein